MNFTCTTGEKTASFAILATYSIVKTFMNRQQLKSLLYYVSGEQPNKDFFITGDYFDDFHTNTESRWDANTDQVLQHHEPCGEAAVFRPHLPDGLPASPRQHSQQGAGMEQGVEIHPLTDDVDRHD